MKQYKIFSLVITLFILSLLVGGAVLAQPSIISSGGASFDNPLGADVTFNTIIANVVKTILGLVGVGALVMFIYGGSLWMTSAGNVERINKGKETLIWASVGLAVIFASYGLVNLLLRAFETTS